MFCTAFDPTTTSCARRCHRLFPRKSPFITCRASFVPHAWQSKPPAPNSSLRLFLHERRPLTRPRHRLFPRKAPSPRAGRLSYHTLNRNRPFPLIKGPVFSVHRAAPLSKRPLPSALRPSTESCSTPPPPPRARPLVALAQCARSRPLRPPPRLPGAAAINAATSLFDSHHHVATLLHCPPDYALYYP
ncbi:hypothetical protein B0H14DRAFT_3438215 [Mycena olivaceomarginata]|nr:hypothetical protein B0H14DRAFT_3438215 [Mycena olivaceomarginata]